MKKLYRCRWNRKILGVIGGLGVFLNVDPSLLRLIFIALLIPTGFFLLPIIYFLAAIFIPEGPKHYIKSDYKILFRSTTDRKLGGVIGGLASYFSVDSSLLRLLFIILMILTAFFPMALTYLACMAIIPEKPESWRDEQ